MAMACADASMPSVIRSLIRGDVPTSVWIGGDLSTAPPAAAILAAADQLIYESGDWGDVRRGFRSLAALLAGVHPPALVDLTWRRLARHARRHPHRSRAVAGGRGHRSLECVDPVRDGTRVVRVAAVGMAGHDGSTGADRTFRGDADGRWGRSARPAPLGPGIGGSQSPRLPHYRPRCGRPPVRCVAHRGSLSPTPSRMPCSISSATPPSRRPSDHALPGDRPRQARKARRSRGGDRAGSLGAGSVAGGEYLRNMHAARLHDDGRVQWVEVCYCPSPLLEERDYWEEYFHLDKVQDAHARDRCRDLTGEAPWACGNCDCSARLEARLDRTGAADRRLHLDRGAVPVRALIYTRAVPSSSLQALLARAQAALERGRGPDAVQLLGPTLRSSTLTREDELALRSDAGRSVAAAGRSRPGRGRAGTHARHVPRHGVRRPALDLVAAARPARLDARRPVARDRPARTGAQASRGRPTTPA